jgi:hypothetical protein
MYARRTRVHYCSMLYFTVRVYRLEHSYVESLSTGAGPAQGHDHDVLMRMHIAPP